MAKMHEDARERVRTMYTRTKKGSQLMPGDELYTSQLSSDTQRNGWTLIDDTGNTKLERLYENVVITGVKQGRTTTTITGNIFVRSIGGGVAKREVRKRFKNTDTFLISKK